MPAHTPSGIAAAVGPACALQSQHARSPAIDSTNAPAVTHIVLMPPRVAISRPPMPGPTM